MKQKGNALIPIILAIVVVLLAGAAIYWLWNSSDTNNLDVVVTSENFETLENIFTEQQEEEALYFSYACMYYIMKDALTTEYLTTQDDNLMFKNIWGKAVQQLVDEGKNLMKENNITLEEYKTQIEELNNTTVE